MSQSLTQTEGTTAAPDVIESLLEAMPWRCIGPPRGGRVVAVAGDPSEPATFYFGACAGGVWKTEDAGLTWENISDKFFQTASVGALAVAPSDPNVIYAGMGEATIRLDVSPGDGVYKSTDAGQSWVHLGLADTHHIARIRVHPHNPDMVYVAALGHAFGPNESRGVYRSTDGGEHWERTLYQSERAGAIDLSLDPRNPRLLYASLWEARRTFWSFSSGGPDSGLYRSADAGQSWTEITGRPGLPPGLKGKIGLAVSPAQSGRIWAMVEAEQGGFFRSDDGGESWQRLTDQPELRYRPWYFSHVMADPQDPDTVYVLNMEAWKSSDGGRTFTKMATPHGDNHDLWIDPANPRRMIEGNDGGACVSLNGGQSWSSIYNQLTAQFYRMDVDNQFPYRVYATQQDNSSLSIPSRTNHGAITWADCYPAGSGESGFIAVHPEKPNLVYVGAVGSSPGGGAALQRYDHDTRQIQLVNVWPEEMSGYGPKDHRYRFAWTFPILFSPHDPEILYTAGNVLFRSTNEGRSWEAISPDLTRGDPTKLEASGGPITKDTTGAENYGAISALLESPHQAGLLWAGSDDGLLHLSRDGGQSWHNVTPETWPEWSYVSVIEASPFEPATVYVAATRYKLDDFQPYLYRTNDYGRTWRKITQGIPAHEFTRVIRADPGRAGLLYAGTETGLYLSFDEGASWRRWPGNLPAGPIYDLRLKENDLILATHGRSLWILDDVTPLHRLSVGANPVAVQLYPPRPTYRLPPDITRGWFEGEGKQYHSALGAPAIYIQRKTETGGLEQKFLDAGQNPAEGVIIYYYLAQAPAGDDQVSLAVLELEGERAGQVVQSFKPKPAGPAGKKEEGPEEEGPWLPLAAGTNRFVWNLRYADAVKVPHNKTGAEGVRGPLVRPGRYEVRLRVGEHSLSQTFEVLKDARVGSGPAEFEAQLSLLLAIRAKVSAAHQAVNTIREIKRQLASWLERLDLARPALAEAATELKQKLAAIEERLIAPDDYNLATMFNHPARLNSQLAGLASVVGSADAAPTRQAEAVFEHLAAQVDEQLGLLEGLLGEELPAFNRAMHAAEIPAVGGPKVEPKGF